MRRKLNVTVPAAAITEDQIASLKLPENSFITKYIDYACMCTDAPPVYHLGVAFSILAVAAGKIDIMTEDENGRRLDTPVRMWSAIVGNSGQRKSEAMDLGVDLLDAAGIEHRLPDDASVEAWHDALAIQPISMLQKDELSGLFDARSRSYTQGLTSWMLSLWGGRSKDRRTKSSGTVWAMRPRLSIMGGIPPEVLEKKTTRGDWSSGFLPRFTFWYGKRTEWDESWGRHPKLQQALARWLRAVPFQSINRLEIPYSVVRPINDWFYVNIESQQDNINDNLFSALTRLQEKAIQFAGLLHMSTLQQPITGCASSTSTVADGSVSVITLGVVRILKQVIEGIFGMTSNDQESRDELQVIAMIKQATKPVTTKSVAVKLEISYARANRLLKSMVESGVLDYRQAPASGPGKPAMLYSIARN